MRYSYQGKRFIFFVLLLVITLTAQLAHISEASAFDGKPPKYVFLFIGDGMSFPQISAAEMYLGRQKTDRKLEFELEKLSFSDFPIVGTASTYDIDSFIPDSASTATALASGIKTRAGVINMDMTKTEQVWPITYALKEMGYKIGIVSSVPITHATPAAFYARVPHRGMAYEIGQHLAESGFDYFAGGAFQRPRGSDGNQKHIHEIVQESGYKLVNTKDEIMALTQEDGKVVAISPILDGSAMYYEIDRAEGDLSLLDFTKKGIELLDNPDGFFMMVEGGKIDWANHANDAAASIMDTIAFSDAVAAALEFCKQHPDDSLIIVTGDHETGGFSIGWSGAGYATFFEILDNVRMSYVEFNKLVDEYRNKTAPEKANVEDLYPLIKETYGILSPNDPDAEKNPRMVLQDFEIVRLQEGLRWSMMPLKERMEAFSQVEIAIYGGNYRDEYEPFTLALLHILNNKAGLNFSTFQHTALPVPVYVKGAGQELFQGFYDNTDINHRLANVMGVPVEKKSEKVALAEGM